MVNSCAWSGTTAAQRRPRCTGPRHGQCVHVIQERTIVAAEEDKCAIWKRSHAVAKSCAGIGTTAAQRRPRCTGPRHGQCVHVIQERATVVALVAGGVEAAEEDQCAICKCRHAVAKSCAWSGTTAAQRRPRCTGPRHGQCVHVIQERTAIVAAEEDKCAIWKRSHAVVISCAGIGTTAAQRRPRCTGPRHGQCVHAIQGSRAFVAAEEDQCAICKCRHAVASSSAWSGTTAAQRRPRCTGPRHGQCVHVIRKLTAIVAAEEDKCAICKHRHAVVHSSAGSGTSAAQRRPIHRRSWGAQPQRKV